VLVLSVAIFVIFLCERCVFVIFAYVYFVKYLFLGDVCCAGCVSDVYCVGVECCDICACVI